MDGAKIQDFVYFYPEGHAAHQKQGHPERPERVEAARSALEEAGLWEDCPKLAPITLSEAVLQAVHTPAYLSLLERACRRGGHLDGDTYVHPASWQLALNSAGGAAAVARAVWRGEARSGFALCRPPGHHAVKGQGMGFCLLNNVAIAAEYLLQTEGARRLAVVDIDLHHGNGTQDIFWTRSDVLFCSTHQIPLYPGTGALDECGEGQGAFYTLNLPMLRNSGDKAYQAALDEVILPVLGMYKPEMILVSFGFDAHWADPLGSLLLSAAGYFRLAAGLAQFADKQCAGRIALFLEGGYDLDAAGACSTAVVSAVRGIASWKDPLGPSPYPESESWKSVMQAARQQWGL